MNKNLTALIDLDSMLHIIANVQYSAGNRDRPEEVRNHARRFIANICTNSTDKEVIMMYQTLDHTNFRNEILPEYKGHRTPSDAITLWKSTILEVYKEVGAIGLNHIESDDAQSILAEYIGYDRTVVVTGDKDMQQIPALFYNPYKKGLKGADRWYSMNVYQANRFFWMQVLAGDPTDMPGELCGIEGIGMGKADKLCDQQLPFATIVQNAYVNKYGVDGFKRANRTYKMVRLLHLNNNDYINESAQEEIKTLLAVHGDYKVDVKNSNNPLFTLTASNLFT